MAFDVTFPHDIGSDVTIKLSDVKGVVIGWSIDENRVLWADVRYADVDKNIQSGWFRMNQLEF